jgi:exportin-2 (importin alpha re-exporter)
MRHCLIVNPNLDLDYCSMKDSPYPPIPDEDKSIVKSRLVALMLEAPSFLFKSISGSLQIVSAHEFPHNWPELMPMLVERLQSNDPNAVLGILKTMNSVLKFYRNKPDTTGYVADLLAILKDFADPLRSLAGSYSAQFDEYQGNVDVMVILLNMMRLIFEIFMSLTSIDLPQVFVDDIGFWMELLRKFLVFTTDDISLLQGDDEFVSQPGALTKIHSSVVRVLSLFVKKYDEDVEPFIQPLLEDVWNILQRVGALSTESQLHYDTLVIDALQFLSLAITGIHHKMFEDVTLLTQLGTLVVMPNIRFMPNAMEMFQYEPLEYIRSDLEGSDSHTRRRSAIDLVKGMRRYYEESVTKVFSEMISQLLGDYAQDPENNWHLKDQAIYLVIALAATSQTRVKGVIAVNELVPLAGFFEESILPELEDVANLNARPVVKADCLRFAISFRRQLSADHIARLLPLFSSYLTAEHTVVASYAAIAIDFFIAMKDQGVSRVPLALIEPYMQTLFENLFSRIMNPSASRFESENPYMGAAIARLISSVGAAIVSVAKTCLESLTTKLAAIYKNPSSSIFVHCIFEGIAGIIGALVKSNRFELCEEAEKDLMPAFDVIFQEEILDLTPYVYQLMAQLIEARKNDAATLWERYGEQFSNVTTANHWERFANIPALTRLVTSYIRFAPTYVNDSLIQLLGVFKRVNELKTYEKYAFRLMLDIMMCVDRSAWQEHIPTIFDLMFTRLREGKSAGYQNQFILFVSNICYAPQLGPDFLVEAMNSVQANVFPMVANDVILRHVGRTPEWKTAVIGLTTLITSAVFFENYNQLWVPMLGAIVDLAVGNKDSLDSSNATPTDYMAREEQGGTADFAKLNFSGQADSVVIPQDIVPQQYIAGKLSELCSNVPGTIPGLCSQLPEQSANALTDILQTYQISLA